MTPGDKLDKLASAAANKSSMAIQCTAAASEGIQNR